MQDFGLDFVAAGHERQAAKIDWEALPEAFARLRSDGFRLAAIAAHDDPDVIRIVYLLCAGPPDRRRELVVRLNRDAPVFPSLASRSYPASRFEREIHDLFGVTPLGHPDLRPLVAHQHWPQGWHPMLRDSGPPPFMAREDEPFPFLEVEGPGVYEIPVGPVHAGLIEPGHFRFSVVGETILTMKSRLWFVHKGIEKLFQGRGTMAGVELAERISGDTAVGHSIAYCTAVEDALDWPVPAEAQLRRAVLLEMERLYNHVADIGALCNDVGFGVAQAHSMRIRERLLRINAELTGHRLLRGAVLPGGVGWRRQPTVGELEDVAVDFRDVVGIALANPVIGDRFTGTAILSRELAEGFGVLGYVARASGIDFDARVAHPVQPHLPEVCVEQGGDVSARFRVRVREFDASVALITTLLSHLGGEDPIAGEPKRRGGGSGVGIVEGWRGTIVHRVEIDQDGALSRVKIVDPSFLNWPALSAALADTIVPDFPLANKSFGLSYAGNDL